MKPGDCMRVKRKPHLYRKNGRWHCIASTLNGEIVDEWSVSGWKIDAWNWCVVQRTNIEMSIPSWKKWFYRIFN